ncbi:hypothetical protein EZJ19_08180 [Parasulfuritortus cantonensis]|uniref:Uncharacterized protein n=1 Tax=Parasulfuritortus cantonensis TaxID=2528202 RepID=A0A4R1BD85_9PROT|nr:hypothetical protein [Parasulfuritortus cantonensis]TCJ15031.1 hypothetical protein EZJ19_08180 [Parasulfuritortus cantonensis]
MGTVTEEARLLVAVAYGEGSAKDVFEEMAAIASVMVRQAKARGYTLLQFLQSKEAQEFSFVLVDGNARFDRLMNATEEAIGKDSGMKTAVKAARHAIGGLTDYSNGAWFWDGADLKSNYARHQKVNRGIRFSSDNHNIYSVKEKSIPEVVKYWEVKDKNGVKRNASERGRYTCTYESTTALGGTVFWRYTREYLQATGGKEHR